MKKAIAILLSLVCVFPFMSCNKTENSNDKLSVVATVFPQYDFTREIAKDKADIKMLLSPGKESHTYDPAAKDIFTIQNCDVFIYIGGESDSWVDKILASADNKDMTVIKLMDCVKPVYEETVEGMESEHGNEHIPDTSEYDEHIWTSPENAKLIVDVICNALCGKDESNSEFYIANAQKYKSELDNLEKDTKEVIANAKRKYIVIADRFPIRYFTEFYSLEYSAAFPGCSSKTEPSPQATAYLINKVKEENIPVIFKIELSDGYVAKAISEATGAEILTFYSLHNVSKADFDAGENYISLMRKNIESLKKALN